MLPLDRHMLHINTQFMPIPDQSSPPLPHSHTTHVHTRKQIVNMLVNNGDPKVSPESATFYGYVTTVVRVWLRLSMNRAYHHHH